MADIDRLILDIHAAPLVPHRWADVLESLCRLQGADKALLFSVPEVQGADFWSVSAGLPAAALAEYSVEFAREDVWLREATRRGATAAGTLFTGEQLIERRSYKRTRFYNEYLARQNIDPFMNVVLRAPAHPHVNPPAVLSFYRDTGRPVFAELECQTLRHLTPPRRGATSEHRSAGAHGAVLHLAAERTVERCGAPGHCRGTRVAGRDPITPRSPGARGRTARPYGR